MRRTSIFIRKAVSLAAGLASLTALALHADGTTNEPLATQKFLVDLTEFLMDETKGCDPGGFDDEPIYNTLLEVFYPPTKPLNQPVQVRIGIKKKELRLPIPISETGEFSYDGPMTAKYFVFGLRNYALTMKGVITREKIDVRVRIERQDPKNKKKYCPSSFRIASTTKGLTQRP